MKDADKKPVSEIVGERGIKSSKDFADFMSALMADVVSGRVDPRVADSACKAGEMLLKVASMQMEYSGDSHLFDRPPDTPPDKYLK